MIIPEKLRIGDTIGVVAPSNPIIDDNIKELGCRLLAHRHSSSYRT